MTRDNGDVSCGGDKSHARLEFAGLAFCPSSPFREKDEDVPRFKDVSTGTQTVPGSQMALEWYGIDEHGRDELPDRTLAKVVLGGGRKRLGQPAKRQRR